MEDLIIKSKEIFDIALAVYQPKAIVMMMSGGDDSLTTYHVARQLGIRFDAAIHGNTRTGIEEATKFAINEMTRHREKLIIADAGDCYVDYVNRKGFFGKGEKAHDFSYHVLKSRHFTRVVSQHLRKRRRNFPILFINGARRSESRRREVTMASPYRKFKGENNIWVNLINDWDKEDCRNYLEGNSIERNPVSVLLCRSGECMCGTMQTPGDRHEAKFFFPKWGKWLDDLEKFAIEKHGFGWNQLKPNVPIIKSLDDGFQPMCTGCKVNFNHALTNG